MKHFIKTTFFITLTLMHSRIIKAPHRLSIAYATTPVLAAMATHCKKDGAFSALLKKEFKEVSSTLSMQKEFLTPFSVQSFAIMDENNILEGIYLDYKTTEKINNNDNCNSSQEAKAMSREEAISAIKICTTNFFDPTDERPLGQHIDDISQYEKYLDPSQDFDTLQVMQILKANKDEKSLLFWMWQFNNEKFYEVLPLSDKIKEKYKAEIISSFRKRLSR